MNGPRWHPLFTGPLRRPRLVLLIALALCALSLWLATRAHPTSSLQDLIGRNDPAASALQRVVEDFPAADELLLLVTLDKERAPEYAAPALRGIAAVIDLALKRNPETAPLIRSVSYAASPQLIDFFKNEAIPSGLYYLDGAEYNSLLARLTPEAMREQLRQDESMIAAPGPAADALSRTLLKDPLRLREFLGGRLNQQGFKTWNNGPDFISPDARSILIRIAGTRPPSDLAFCKEFTAKVTGEARRVVPPPFIVEASGAYAIAAASESSIRRDLTASVIGSLIVMQLVFLLGYRNILAFLMAFAPIAIGLCVAFGAHALITPALTPLTAVIGASLVGCGIDYSIYFLSYYQAAASANPLGANPEFSSQSPRPQPTTARLETVLGSLARPLLAGAATSIIGFAAVAFSSVQALRDFAVLGVLGLTLCLAGVLWVLPALLGLLGRFPRLASPGARLPTLYAPLVPPRLSIAMCLIALALAGVCVGLRPPRLETNLNVMHPSPNAPLETERAIGEKFGSSDTLLIYIEADTPDELLRRAHEAARAIDPLRKDLSISGVFGLSTILPDPSLVPARRDELARLDIDRILTDFDAAVADSAFNPSAFSEYKTFLRTFLTPGDPPTLATLSKSPDLASMLTSAGTTHPAAITLVSIAPDDHEGLQDARARDAVITTLRTALAGVRGTTLTGHPVIGYDVEHAVRRDLPIMIGVTASIVLLILIPTFRGWRNAALSCVPVAFGVLVLLGYMALTGERFNLANIVAIPLLIGVGEDYGIFLVAMSSARLRPPGGSSHPDTAGPESEEAGRTRLASAVHAILLTSASSIIGFGSLAFTSVPAIQSLGRVIAIGIAACVIGALFLLAPILRPTAADRPHR